MPLTWCALHLFGLKDEDAREDTPINKMPSYLSMEEHAMKDKTGKKATW
jgi:putative DNA primase/helicase